jgi:uncharacterized protein
MTEVRMDGRRLSYLTLVGMSGLVLLQNQACVDENGGGEPNAVAEAPSISIVLSDVGPQVVVPALERFQGEMELLSETLSAWEDGGSGSREAAQDQWKVAMAVWQELEIFQVGPAGSSLDFIAGQDIRDEIYSWPTVNPCRVDQRTVEADWGNADFFESNLVNVYGLDALEHLLFSGSDSVCPSQVLPVSDGSWDALGSEGVSLNRANYASAVVGQILLETDLLTGIWSEGAGFSELLAMGEGSPYTDEVEALNAVFDALFYLEVVTKDLKLAKPLGYVECDEELCLDDLEGLDSQTTIASIRANLVGFHTLFTGGDGVGMDALLEEIGHGDLAVQMLADIEETLVLSEEFDGAFDVAIQERPEEVGEFYDSLRNVTTALKRDLATVLNMKVPAEATGDND